MKFLALILFLAITSLPDFSQATEYQCTENKDKILNALKVFPECQNDNDCRYFDYGYPWQTEPCTKAIVSRTNETRTVRYLGAIEKYNKNCIFNNDSENKKYQTLETATKNAKCEDLPRVFCLKGICRNQFYPLFFDDDSSIR